MVGDWEDLPNLWCMATPSCKATKRPQAVMISAEMTASSGRAHGRTGVSVKMCFSEKGLFNLLREAKWRALKQFTRQEHGRKWGHWGWFPDNNGYVPTKQRCVECFRVRSAIADYHKAEQWPYIKKQRGWPKNTNTNTILAVAGDAEDVESQSQEKTITGSHKNPHKATKGKSKHPHTNNN